jgi:integrase
MKGEGRIYQRPGRPVWMLDYYGEIGGKRVRLRESSGTTDREKARSLLRSRVESAHVAAKVGAEVETSAHRRFTVAQALDDYLKDLALREKKSAKGERYRLGPESPLRQALGAVKVCALSRSRLVRYAEERRADGMANKTINNDLCGLRSALLLAEESGKVLRLPAFPGKLRERVRQGFPDAAEPEALAKVAPPWLAEMIRFAYATGWRRGELLSLRWEWIDFDASEIRLPDSKNDEGRVVPIAGELVDIVERLRRARTVTRTGGSVVLAETVFHAAGEPITRKRFVLAWNAARKAAGLPHRLFHDFRRAAARRLTNAGVPQVVAMRITGHKTPSMYRRYSIVETGDMAKALAALTKSPKEGAKVVRFRRGTGTPTGTPSEIS